MTPYEKQIQEALKTMDISSLENLESLSPEEMLEHVQAQIQKAKATGKGHRATVTFKQTRTITKGAGSLKDGSGNFVPLFVPMFGVLEYENNYSRIFPQFLPKDGSVILKSFGKTPDGQSLQAVFRNAADDTEETVTLSTINNSVYTTLLRGLQLCRFDINKPKLIISDTARIDQFDQPLTHYDYSIFTKTEGDSLSPQDDKKEYLSDNTVRVIDEIIHVKPERTLIPYIVPPTTQALNGSFYYTLICKLENIVYSK